MGSPTGEREQVYGNEEEWEDNEHQHLVRLTKGFEMQATEVTQLQYVLVMSTNPSFFRGQKKGCDKDNYRVILGKGLCANHPVENVSWNDAQEFIKRLNKIQNKYTYRLPTEAEWEYAARAGTPPNWPYSFGSNDANELNNYGWYEGNSSETTHAVASKKPNPWGLYDMHGNVWEWTQDFYGEDYGLKDLKAVTVDPTGPTTGSIRVIRNGSWYDDAGGLRFAIRSYGAPGYRGSIVGFRLVRSSR